LLPGDVVRSHAATGRPTADRAAALASYYDSEVDDRATRALSDQREDHRDLFIDAVTNDGARSVLEIGCGPGIDATALAGAGLDYTGIDLSFAAVAMCRGKGLRVCTASAVDLPFTDNAFDAAWTMSTLLHLDDVEFESALREVRRVMRPGGLLAIGLWGDHVTSEQHLADKTGQRPPRYFRFRSDHDLRHALAELGQIEQWVTWTADLSPYHYQWALVRTHDSPRSSGPEAQSPRRSAATVRARRNLTESAAAGRGGQGKEFRA
jgi:SAM-dependent methyltransferase